MEKETRLNKYLADQQIASRREADVLIEQGKVLVNGKKAKLGQKISSNDTVEVAGKTKKKQYFAYYKGRGIITHSPTAGEVDIATRIKNDYNLTEVTPVGRLDKDSEGLIILSNDGRITGPLLSPENGNEKEYEVLVDKNLSGMAEKLMSKGVDIEGYKTKPAVVKKNPRMPNASHHTYRERNIKFVYATLVIKFKHSNESDYHVKLGKLKPNQYRRRRITTTA